MLWLSWNDKWEHSVIKTPLSDQFPGRASNEMTGYARIRKSVLRNSLVGDDAVLEGVRGELTVGDHSEVHVS